MFSNKNLGNILGIIGGIIAVVSFVFTLVAKNGVDGFFFLLGALFFFIFPCYVLYCIIIEFLENRKKGLSIWDSFKAKEGDFIDDENHLVWILICGFLIVISFVVICKILIKSFS
ncbi:MAG: hypothetical protein ACK5MK_06430 [Dysgonomonas sp.]